MRHTKRQLRPSYNFIAVLMVLSIISSTQSHGSYSLVQNIGLSDPVTSTAFLPTLNKFIVSFGSKLRIYQASTSSATFQAPEYNAASITLVTLPTVKKVIGIGESLNFAAIIEQGHLVVLSNLGI